MVHVLESKMSQAQKAKCGKLLWTCKSLSLHYKHSNYDSQGWESEEGEQEDRQARGKCSEVAVSWCPVAHRLAETRRGMLSALRKRSQGPE